MIAVRVLGVVSLGVLAALPACGDDGGGGGGEFSTLRGRVAVGPSARSVGTLAAVDTGRADAIWAIPAGNPRRALQDKIVLDLAEDGSFSFTPDQQGVDYILALIDTAACTQETAREDWSEADIDARTACFLGYVSIPDAESSGSMVLIPTGSMTGNADIGEVTPSTQTSDEADSAQTLEDIAPSFSVGLDGLRDIARTDNTLKALVWSYANTSDDGSEWYELSPNYSFIAPNTLEEAASAPTDADAFVPAGWRVFWGATVDVDSLQANIGTPGYLEFIAPHPVNDSNGLRHYKSEEAMETDFITGRLVAGEFQGSSEGLTGAADGNWKIRRAGEVVSKFDMRISSPFDSKDGVLDLSYITSFVPTLQIQADGGGAISNLSVGLKTWDGEGYVDANASQAFSRFELAGIQLNGDGSGGCVGNEEFSTVWTAITDDLLSYDPENSWVSGPGDASACGLVSVSFNYKIFGAEYSYEWRPSYDPFDIQRRSSSFLPLDPDNAVSGAYVSFHLVQEQLAYEWRDADLWLELSNLVTTPTAGLVQLGAGEDGVFHLRKQSDARASFYLEYAGAGSPPASYETTATLTVHDGRPGRSKRSHSYDVSWSNTAAPAEAATLSIASYEDMPQVFVSHGGRHEFRVLGSISGVTQGEELAFSPASAINWPADEYELVSSRMLLLDGGTLDTAAPLCADSTCSSDVGNPAEGLGFYAPEAGDFDYQIFYTYRWAGAGSTPTMSSMVWKWGAALLHALATDNAAAPALQSTTPSATMTLSVEPSNLSIAAGPLRVTFSAEISQGNADGFFGDAITIELPAGAAVIPRTSLWTVGALEESLAEPTVQGNSNEWSFATFLPAGSEAVLKFDAFLAPTMGAQEATGRAWVGNTAVDLTATLGDDTPANATATVTP